jgi:hypothetical protein
MSDQNRKRVVKIGITPRLLMQFFIAPNAFRCVEGLPNGAEFRGFAHDYNRNCINIFVSHESFAEVIEGHECPDFKRPLFTRILEPPND